VNFIVALIAVDTPAIGIANDSIEIAPGDTGL